MKLIDQIQTTIQNLPEEAQQDLWEYVQNLSHKYLPTSKTPYEILEESGFIGSCSTDQNLSTNYKQALTEGWSKKYGIQDKSQPRQKGNAKGKLIIHSEDNEHLDAFQDYMPQ